MSSPPATYDLALRQNASWEISVTITNPDGSPFVLTGYTGKSEIRDATDDTVLASPTVTVLDATYGVIRISLTAAQTATLEPTPRSTCHKPPLPIWDVLLANTDHSQVFPLLAGTVTVKQGVTHWTL